MHTTLVRMHIMHSTSSCMPDQIKMSWCSLKWRLFTSCIASTAPFPPLTNIFATSPDSLHRRTRLVLLDSTGITHCSKLSLALQEYSRLTLRRRPAVSAFLKRDSDMSALKTAADVAHKATTTGLVGFFGYMTYNLTGMMLEGKTDGKVGAHPQAGFIGTIRAKAKEEYEKYYDVGHREWYDKDDDSYLKKLPRPGRDYKDS